jgi:hypothetical protein
MARPCNDWGATETHAVTEPELRRARKPLELSPCWQTAVRTAGQRSIRVTGLGEVDQQRYPANSASSALASNRSAVSKPSVNQW